MGTEIERKFLVKPSWIDDLVVKNEVSPILRSKSLSRIRQGYLQNSPNKVVRIRSREFIVGCMESQAFITIKGPTVGISRAEFEYPIPFKDATLMLSTMCNNVIEKYRHEVQFVQDNDRIWEIDQFTGRHEGLIVGEVELENEAESIQIPSWVIKEVSHDARYYNSNLCQMSDNECTSLLHNP